MSETIAYLDFFEIIYSFYDYFGDNLLFNCFYFGKKLQILMKKLRKLIEILSSLSFLCELIVEIEVESILRNSRE